MSGSKLIIITAPSGAGKTTMVNYIMEKFPKLSFSTSATTREPRKNEVDKEDYFFLSKDEFTERIEKGEFIEWEEVYKGQYYGTLKSEVEAELKSGKDLLFDIDVQGALSIKEQFPENSLSIFIKAPNLQTLMSRLSNRKSETAETLKIRIVKAKKEMLYRDNFDTVIINDKLDQAFSDIHKVVSSFLNNDS